MSNRFLYAIVILLILFSCNRKNEQNQNINFQPKVVKANGYIVINEQIAKPKVSNVGDLKIVPVGKPKIVPANTNIHFAGKPVVVIAGIPVTKTPGHDTLLLPEIVPVIDSPILAGIPDIVIAKDGYIKDHNPQNFISYGKLQGLKHDVIRCMIQDKNGNLWFGTDGGGVSKYDGKYFTNYTEKEGLSNNAVLCILEDKNGNLWFGTNEGVNKYDGKFFTRYTKKEGLINNVVYSILQDQKGNFWFGTNDGLSKFDGKYFSNFTIKMGLGYNRVQSILQDGKGDIWFAANGGGVSKYDGKSFTNYNEKDGLSNKYVTCILQDKSGDLWFGTDGGGASKFDGKYFTHYTEKEGLSNNSVRSIIQDKNGNIWFGTDGGGISKYNGNCSDSKQKSFTHYTENEGLINNVVRSILQDKSGNLWFGTDGGVSKYNGKYFTIYTQNEGLSNNIVRCILKDKSGNLWFGTDGGGATKYDGKYFTNYSKNEGLINNNVLSIIQDRSGNLWFGTDGGVCKYDGLNFTCYTEKNGLSNNSVYSILQDQRGNFWFGTDGGYVCKLEQGNGNDYYFTYFSEKEGLSKNSVYCILQDKKGNIWFGTNGGGVIKYDGDRVADIERGEKIPLSEQKDLKKLNGKLVKTFTHYTEKEGLSNNAVLCMMQDKSGNIWFGTDGGGVSKYNGTTFTHYTEKEGLIDNTVRSIIEDKHGNIWLGSRFGLSKLSEKNLDKLSRGSGTGYNEINNQQPVIFKNYTYDDGFLGTSCNRGSMCQDNDGTIWIGTRDRLMAYYPEGDVIDTMPPNIQITGIELFNESIAWANFENRKDTFIVLRNGVKVNDFNFEKTTGWYGLPVKLSLKYNTNFLTFSFIGVTQNQSEKVNYQFKLDGIDENWSAPALRNEISYGNLPNGIYTFRVKAMNCEGYWSQEFTYSFTIRPHWSQTLWFRFLLAVFIVACLLGLYFWRISLLRIKQKKLEQVVKEKTSEVLSQKGELETINEELKQSNEELSSQREELESALNNLQSAQKQLIQSEKMASLGILAAGVAHEINNPLNFINGGIIGLEDYFNENPPEHIDRVYPLLQGIQVGVSRAAAIVTSLNHYSRRDELNRIQCDIHAILENCLIMLQNETKNRIEIIKEYTQIPYNLICNEGKMHQAMLNILANAVQSISDKGVITIQTKVELKKLIIYVIDTGNGINKENLSKIMDPFFTTKEPGKGTGLGLSITYNIIQEHNGSIEFESDLGKGTKVTICLPLTKI